MSKLSIKTAFSCARIEFCKWLISQRMIIIAMLFVFVYLFAVKPLTTNAEIMGEPLNILEPYIATLNSGSLLLIIPLGFFALSSDFPRIDGNMMFEIIRTGRLNWFVGQLINLIMMCTTYLAFIFAASVLPLITNAERSGQWSRVVLDFAVEYPEFSQNFGALLLPKNLFNHLTLSAAAVQSSLLVLAYLFLLGMILLFFAIIGKKAAGSAVCAGIIAAGAALCSIRSEFMWALPMSNSIVWLHFTEFQRTPVYPIGASWLYFGTAVSLLTVGCFFTLRRLKFMGEQ